nr:hypothetical protein [Mycolicibacterium fortuitum]
MSHQPAISEPRSQVRLRRRCAGNSFIAAIEPRSQVRLRRRCAGNSFIAAIIALATESAV